MPKRRALVVALDEYPNPANNLPSCVNDANAFAGVIQSIYGFDEIRRLENSQATLSNVESGLDWLFEKGSSDDRLVFYFSGHGYQAQRGQDLDEVLCLYDEFLFDDDLTAKTQSLAPGVFTLVSDSCHSGGLYKVVVLDGQTVEIAQTKVLKVPPKSMAKVASFDAPGTVRRLRYRPFGAAKNSQSAVEKRFGNQPTKSFDEAGQLAMNGLLLSACLEDETASASTAKTEGKSAFTFVLLNQLNSLGSGVSNASLMESVGASLKTLGFRQTPVLMEPAQPAALGSRSFLLLDGASVSSPSIGTGDTSDPILQAIQAAISSLQGNKAMQPAIDTSTSSGTMPPQGDDKFWGAIASLVVSTLPTVIDALSKGGYVTEKDFQSAPGGQDKFFGAILGIVGSALPAVIQALSKQGFAPAKDFGGSQDKFWGALARVVATTLPTIIREVTKSGIEPQKDFGGEEKFWGAIASVVSAALPAVVQALSKQGAAPPKGFETAPENQEKFWGALASVVATALPAVVQALRKGGYEPQKDFGGGEEKFWGALASTLASAIPVVIEALSKGGYEPQKDFGGEEKFWRAYGIVMDRCLPQILSRVALDEGQLGKGFDMTKGLDTGDDKFWGAVARVVASALPTIVGELTKGAVLSNGHDDPAASMPPHLIDQIVNATGPALQRKH
jgi:hypothetical protein